MLDKSMLGTRFTCFSCGTKFYDLNRPEPLCPECGADQRQAPVRDIKALLSAGSRAPVEEDADVEFEEPNTDEADDDEEEEEDMFDDYED